MIYSMGDSESNKSLKKPIISAIKRLDDPYVNVTTKQKKSERWNDFFVNLFKVRKAETNQPQTCLTSSLTSLNNPDNIEFVEFHVWSSVKRSFLIYPKQNTSWTICTKYNKKIVTILSAVRTSSMWKAA